jgi:hypothetical protein
MPQVRFVAFVFYILGQRVHASIATGLTRSMKPIIMFAHLREHSQGCFDVMPKVLR